MSGHGSTAVTAPSTPGLDGWTRATGASVGAGVVLGVLTNLLQGWLPGAWNQIANSGAVWSVAAFAAGAVLAGRVPPATAAVGGLCAEVGLVVGYYGYAEFGRDGMGDPFWPLVWMVMACVAGPLFGTAGVWWRQGTTAWRRVTALGALAGVFGQEAIHYAWVLRYAPQAWACLGVALLVPLLMARTHRERALSLLAAVPLSFLAYAVVQLPLNSI
ncbi:DUF6518 family protein [Streptomyces cavernae]|uniref:DUF6518 family protein n=1 Tax=Streptomyces cavernae TaxID=2259034 RepID=UPI001EE3B1F8|nr:DUF6518 family protein [Streptomyces cavernae]